MSKILFVTTLILGTISLSGAGVKMVYADDTLGGDLTTAADQTYYSALTQTYTRLQGIASDVDNDKATEKALQEHIAQIKKTIDDFNSQKSHLSDGYSGPCVSIFGQCLDSADAKKAADFDAQIKAAKADVDRLQKKLDQAEDRQKADQAQLDGARDTYNDQTKDRAKGTKKITVAYQELLNNVADLKLTDKMDKLESKINDAKLNIQHAQTIRVLRDAMKGSILENYLISKSCDILDNKEKFCNLKDARSATEAASRKPSDVGGSVTQQGNQASPAGTR